MVPPSKRASAGREGTEPQRGPRIKEKREPLKERTRE